jgi:hypothetical protein
MDDPRTRLDQSLAQSLDALKAIRSLHASLLELESALIDLQCLAGTPRGDAAVKAAQDVLEAAARRRIVQ